MLKRSANARCIIFFVFLLSSVFIHAQQKCPYKVNSPDKIFVLPDVLREISGITVIDSSSMACVQDENGIIYTLDKRTGQIKDQFPFGWDGDYEGIARVGDVTYVLRSDGILFEVSKIGNDPKVITYTTAIPADNNEGLCYDKENDRLLIGCKSKPGKGPEFKNAREIYAFDLIKKQLLKKPIFQFDVAEIKELALKKGIKLPVKEKKKGEEEVLRFTTSAIAIQPLSKQLYLISSADKLLFVFSMEGKLEDIKKLDPMIFNKPEGIIFFESGDMVITNEGLDKRPTLLFFGY